MFNEISKSEGAENLCLPMLFKLRVEKGHSQGHSLLTMMDQGDIDMMEEPSIIDLRFISQDTSHIKGQHLHVPFNVKRISASALLSQQPDGDKSALYEVFYLSLEVDGEIQLKYRTENVEFMDVEVNGEDFTQMNLDFNVDFSQVRKTIVGAKSLRLKIEVLNENLIDEKGF